MTFKLRKLSVKDGEDVYNMLQDIDNNENGFINHCRGMDYEHFGNWLMSSAEKDKGIGLESWMVAQTIYWLYVDNTPVGIAKLRHGLTRALEIEGGHLGYAIAYPHRNRGYCTKLIGLILPEAAKMGIDQVLVTAKNSNQPSIKAALNNGGIVEKCENGRHYIWIKTR